MENKSSSRAVRGAAFKKLLQRRLSQLTNSRKRGKVETSIFLSVIRDLTKFTRDWTTRLTGFPAACITSTARSCVLCRRSTPSTSIILSPIWKQKR